VLEAVTRFRDMTQPLSPSRLVSAAAGLGLALLVLAGAAPPAAAQGGKLDAHYIASLGGIPVGKGSWMIEVNGNRYSASAQGGTIGLLKLFASGEGSSSVRGNLAGGQPAMAAYASTLKTDRKTDMVKLLVNGGAVKDVNVSPPLEPDDERVPVTEAHRRGITDPMTASLVRVPPNLSMMGPDACRNAAIFDGRARYDLYLAYKRMDHVKAEKGYDGPVVVCSVQFKPVAGFILSRTAVKYLISQRDMEVWLAPMAGTRVMVPYRVSVPTPIGLAVLEATDFVSTVQAASNEKGQ